MGTNNEERMVNWWPPSYFKLEGCAREVVASAFFERILKSLESDESVIPSVHACESEYGESEYGESECRVITVSTVTVNTVIVITVRASTVRVSTVRVRTVRVNTMRVSTVRTGRVSAYLARGPSNGLLAYRAYLSVTLQANLLRKLRSNSTL